MNPFPFQAAFSLLQAIPPAIQAINSMQGPQKANPPASAAVPPPPAAIQPVQSAAANVPLTNNTNAPPPVVQATNLCDFCHAKPKHVVGGKTHPYCSKTCASYTKNASSGASTNSAGNCDICRIRPKYTDGTKTHSYCGKTCAQKATGMRTPSRQSTTMSAPTLPPPIGGCHVKGCNKAVVSAFGDFCSKAHKTLAETMCLLCCQAPKQRNSHFCGPACADAAAKKGPALLEVPLGHITFKSVADQFTASWRHTNSTCPAVRRIYKIISTPQSVACYDTYRASVEARGKFVASGRSSGNENRRWHGTRRECLLGDAGKSECCSSTTCSLCCIVRTSFDLSLFGKKTGWGRFGRGIYTSSTSSKSNDYSSNSSTSTLKAMLLNKVIVGKGHKMTQDNTTLTAPPAGYDSVLAEVGGSLNYDELVVYCNDAIRPSFLVMYDA